MPSYTVPITGPDGSPGTITVNASDPAAAVTNAAQGGNIATGGATPVAAAPNAQTSGINYTAPGAPGAPQPANPSQGAGIDAILQALQRGDMRAFDEAVRQFNANFGLNVAGLTGTYNGQPTLPAMTSYANQFGTWGVPTAGQQTLAAQQQGYAQQTGLINMAAAQQANPFRQAQVIGQLGGLLRGGGVAGFQAPGQAQGQTDFSGMGNLQRMIDDIRGGPNAINSQSTQSVLDAIPTPNKLNSVEFGRASPLTQNMVLQGMSEKYGLSPDDSLAQIKATLPQFVSPTTMGSVRR